MSSIEYELNMNRTTPFILDGKVALVTGGLGKLGPIFVTALYRAGASVAVLDLPGKMPSKELAAFAKESDKKVIFVEGDITDKHQLLSASDEIREKLGRVQILVNNAGLDTPPGVVKTYALTDIPLEIVSQIFSVNVFGAFLCMQVFGEDMVREKSGSIINIGSLYASVSPDERLYDHIPSQPQFLKPPAYGASKAALLNLTKYFAAHWGKFGVRVNMLSPGGIEGGQDAEFKKKFTARVPLGRLGAEEDLAGPMVFLASDAARYITGENLKVDGGFAVW